MPVARDYTGCIATFSGRIINPFDPDPADIAIEDIAHALSLQCRFTGHTKHLYTVGQHSVLAAWLLKKSDPEVALWALLHDASEAYLADIARPVKAMWPEYKVYEQRLMEAIVERFGLEATYPMPDAVKDVDDFLLAHEIRYLMPEHEIYDRWQFDYELSIPERMFAPVTPGSMENNFLWEFKELGGK